MTKQSKKWSKINSQALNQLYADEPLEPFLEVKELTLKEKIEDAYEDFKLLMSFVIAGVLFLGVGLIERIKENGK